MSDTEHPHQPHDKIFKAGFGDPANASAFLRAYLPATLASGVDWAGLRLEPGSFVDSQMRASESDLLFSAPQIGGGESLVYVLFEHQREEDRWIALRLLRYQVRIWERYREAHPQMERLPSIVPVVLAQNARRWEIPERFAELIDVPEGAGGFVVDFGFRLLQLAELPYDRLLGTPAGILTLRVLKAERVDGLLGDAVWDERLMVEVSREVREMVLRYILFRADVDSEDLERRLAGVQRAEIKESAMTIAQQLIQRGRQEGWQEGRQEGRQEGVHAGQVLALQETVLEALCARVGEVPARLEESVRGITDESRLRELFRVALRCESIEAFVSAS